MAQTKPCVVSNLPDDIKSKVTEQLAKGIPAPSISRWLASQGHKVTPRQLYNFKDKTVPTVAPRESGDPVYEEDATDSVMFKRLLKTSLDAVENLRDTYRLTGDLRTARVLREMLETASGILKYRLQYDQPDPVVNVQLQIASLEAELALAEDSRDFRNPDINTGDSYE
ncbi:hypothetical protein CLI64_13625 [Nostoc sp. CENA543]|uniref:hypothetical protein n=1 Tax=Nostoc sp. CENA543 TaxID=1869241 RepID=UPI000CA325A9|nr:hypothetical protein [Nostoc sp. CENA543]AUT01356.1 hypothetical protein CLI64_13625 [Nostoc sp. CENA543]